MTFSKTHLFKGRVSHIFWQFVHFVNVTYNDKMKNAKFSLFSAALILTHIHYKHLTLNPYSILSQYINMWMFVLQLVLSLTNVQTHNS